MTNPQPQFQPTSLSNAQIPHASSTTAMHGATAVPAQRRQLRLVETALPAEEPQGTGHLAKLPSYEHAWRRAQLNDFGLNSQTIALLVDLGLLVRVRHGCYVRADYWHTLDERGQERLYVLLHAHTAVALSRADFAYSHVSAARLHGLPLWRADSCVHLTATAKKSTLERAPDVKIHCRPLNERECCEIDGVRVTNQLRTLVDCALTMKYKQVLIMMDFALRNGVPRAVLQREADKFGRHRGIKIFRAALAFANGSAESAGESLTRELIDVCGLPAPVLQLEVASRGGVYRADFAWPRYKVIVEFDGEGKYFDYRPTADVLRDERRRENELIEQGWTVIRIVWGDLFNEHRFKTRITAALRRGGMK